jgi:hypothetical protein
MPIAKRGPAKSELAASIINTSNLLLMMSSSSCRSSLHDRCRAAID